jgi:hypothetical protein
MAAAVGRDVGEDLAAAAGYELGEALDLSADLSRAAGVVLTMALDSSVVNIAASADGMEVKREHAAGTRAGIKHRHCARLARRRCSQRSRMPGRVGAAAVTGDPDVRSPRRRSRDDAPSGLCDGAREAVRAVRVH